MKSPFVPYEAGSGALTYNDLTAEEKALVDRGRNVDYSGVHAGYKTAVQQRSQEAHAAAAALQIGIDVLETGVVP